MIYLDYKSSEITKEGNKNIINIISNMLKIDKEIIIKYIEIYDKYPIVTLQDDDKSDYNLDKQRLNNILRSFKIKKIKYETSKKENNG